MIKGSAGDGEGHTLSKSDIQGPLSLLPLYSNKKTREGILRLPILPPAPTLEEVIPSVLPVIGSFISHRGEHSALVV